MKLSESTSVILPANADLTALRDRICAAIDKTWPPGENQWNNLEQLTPLFAVWQSQGSYYKATWNIDESNNITFGSRVEVEMTFVPTFEVSLSESFGGTLAMGDVEANEEKGWTWKVRLMKSGLTHGANVDLGPYGYPGRKGFKHYLAEAVKQAAPLFEGAPFILRSEEDHLAHMNGGERKVTQQETIELISGHYRNVEARKEPDGEYGIYADLELRRNAAGIAVRKGLMELSESKSPIVYELSPTLLGDGRVLNTKHQYPTLEVNQIKQIDSVDPCLKGNAGGLIFKLAEAAHSSNTTMTIFTGRERRRLMLNIGALQVKKNNARFKKLAEAAEESGDAGGGAEDEDWDMQLAQLYLDDKDHAGVKAFVGTPEEFLKNPNAKKLIFDWLDEELKEEDEDEEKEEGEGEDEGEAEGEEGEGTAVYSAESLGKGKAKKPSAIAQRVQAIEKQNSERLLRAKLAEARMPEKAGDVINNRFKPLMEKGIALSESDIDASIREMRELLGATSRTPMLTKTQDESDKTSRGVINFFMRNLSESGKKLATEELGYDPTLSKFQAWNSFKELYMDVNGLSKLGSGFGRDQRGRLSEAFSAGISANILYDALHIRMRVEYNAENELDDWRKIARPMTATDFRANNNYGYGWFDPAAMPDIANSGDEYQEVPLAGSEKVPITLAERGGLFSINWRDVVDDRTDFVQTIPTRIALGLKWKLYKHVMTDYNNVATTTLWIDGLPVATTAKGNASAAPIRLTQAEVIKARNAMFNMMQLNSNTPIMLKPRWLLHGSDDFQTAYQITTPGAFSSQAEGPYNVVALASQTIGLQAIEVAQGLWGNHNWLVIGDSPIAESYDVVFYNGQQEPQLFQEVQESGESFTAKKMRFRFEHHWQGGFVNYRYLYAEQVS